MSGPRSPQTFRPTAIVAAHSADTRAQLGAALAAAGVHIIAETNDSAETRALYASLKPDLLFVDVVLSGSDGVETAQHVLGRFPDARVVVSSAFVVLEHVLTCHRIGVAQFLLRPVESARIAKMVRDLLERDGQVAA